MDSKVTGHFKDAVDLQIGENVYPKLFSLNVDTIITIIPQKSILIVKF